MMEAHTKFETANGSKYMQQLCKHFAHKVAVDYDAERAEAALPPGPANMTADAGGLNITVRAQEAEGLTVAKGIIERHLIKFAFREPFDSLTWSA